ncbi:MAG TPA: hypothetical protein VJQ46_07940 [Gemmatimonadales bacterium]|nr:hypothetical protein [Gemmatimonadales bacterium]
MKSRKPSIDDLDDTDDQDGVLEDEKREDNDLKLRSRKPDEVDLGGATEPEDEDESAGS